MTPSNLKGAEIRLNKATRQWVIFAPHRGKRPRDMARKKEEKKAVPSRDPECPFCPGNEDRLSKVILETGPENGRSWKTRVVFNKYPALSKNGGTQRIHEGIYLKMDGYGQHEVVIETPRHDRQPSEMSVEEIERIIETYHRRYLELMKQHWNMLILIFRNHGWRAGTSLVHPHSQIVVTGMVPQHVRWREDEAQRYFDEFGRCVYCDIIEFEMQNSKRVLFENDSFVGFVPYAADVPFEVWIVPKRHQADFGSIKEEEKGDLATVLRVLLKRLHEKLDDPDYNYMINTSARYKADEPQLHWYIQVAPRLTTRAGFEIGSGISINPSIPEEDAAFLNDMNRR